MIEALITLLLFSIGMLALGAMYGRGLAVSHSSYLRSLAAIQAADMAERMRANPFGAVNVYELADNECTAAAQPALPASCSGDCEGDTLTPDELAGWDLNAWCNSNLALFGGLFNTATIKPDDASAPDYYDIQISWGERSVTGNNQKSVRKIKKENIINQ